MKYHYLLASLLVVTACSSLETAIDDTQVEVKLYYGDRQTIIDSDCSATAYIHRSIPKTPTIADATLRSLFSGPTPGEERDGLVNYFTNKDGYFGSEAEPLLSYYEGVSIREGVATLRFSSGAMRYLNSAACTQVGIKSAILDTLQQFETILDVRYSIDGEIVTEWDA